MFRQLGLDEQVKDGSTYQLRHLITVNIQNLAGDTTQMTFPRDIRGIQVMRQIRQTNSQLNNSFIKLSLDKGDGSVNLLKGSDPLVDNGTYHLFVAPPRKLPVRLVGLYPDRKFDNGPNFNPSLTIVEGTTYGDLKEVVKNFIVKQGVERMYKGKDIVFTALINGKSRQSEPLGHVNDDDEVDFDKLMKIYDDKYQEKKRTIPNGHARKHSFD
jgi:hypothetical protein